MYTNYLFFSVITILHCSCVAFLFCLGTDIMHTTENTRVNIPLHDFDSSTDTVTMEFCSFRFQTVNDVEEMVNALATIELTVNEKAVATNKKVKGRRNKNVNYSASITRCTLSSLKILTFLTIPN